MSKKKEEKDRSDLINLILKDECLSYLSSKKSEANIYRLLKVERVEIRHSNILAWLLDPNEEHNVGNTFLRELIKSVLKNSKEDIDEKELERQVVDWTLNDFENVRVKREAPIDKNNKKGKKIDIILTAEAGGNKYLLAIENKVDAKESVAQTPTYRKKIDESYDDYNKKMFVFLTPHGESAEDKCWRKLSYDDVVESLEIAKERGDISERNRLIINDYMNIIKREIIGDEELAEKCNEICENHQNASKLVLKAYGNYKKNKECDERPEINRILEGIIGQHKDAISMLNEYKNDRGNQVAQWIRDVLIEKKDEEGLVFDDKQINKKAYLQFNTFNLMKLLGDDSDDAKSPLETMEKYYYEFNNRSGLVSFKLILRGGDVLDKDLLEKELKIAKLFEASERDDYEFKGCNVLGEKTNMDFSNRKIKEEVVKTKICEIINSIAQIEAKIETVLAKEE